MVEEILQHFYQLSEREIQEIIIPIFGLSNVEINQIMMADPYVSQDYYGCWPSDWVDSMIPQRPMYVCLNYQPVGEIGTHWVCVVYKEKDYIEYFDSFGMEPPENIEAFLKRAKVPVYYNTGQVQDFGTFSCSLFSMEYMKRRARGEDPIDILSSYDLSDLEANNKKIINNFKGQIPL